MNAKTIASALIVAVTGFSLGLPGTAVAGDRQHDRHGPGYSGGHHYKQDRHHKRNYKRHNRRHYGHKRPHYKGRHYRPHYRHHGHRGYGSNYYYYDNDDDDYDQLLFGLITGGILGYALNESQQAQRYSYPPAPRYAPY